MELIMLIIKDVKLNLFSYDSDGFFFKFDFFVYLFIKFYDNGKNSKN